MKSHPHGEQTRIVKRRGIQRKDAFQALKNSSPETHGSAGTGLVPPPPAAAQARHPHPGHGLWVTGWRAAGPGRGGAAAQQGFTLSLGPPSPSPFPSPAETLGPALAFASLARASVDRLPRGPHQSF